MPILITDALYKPGYKMANARCMPVLITDALYTDGEQISVFKSTPDVKDWCMVYQQIKDAHLPIWNVPRHRHRHMGMARNSAVSMKITFRSILLNLCSHTACPFLSQHFLPDLPKLSNVPLWPQIPALQSTLIPSIHYFPPVNFLQITSEPASCHPWHVYKILGCNKARHLSPNWSKLVGRTVLVQNMRQHGESGMLGAPHPESCPLPADPFYIALYINDLVLTQCAPGALTSAVCGIRYGHVTSGLRNPADNLFVKILEGAQRTVGRNSPPKIHRQKEPVTMDMVKAIVDMYASPFNLLHHRFILTCLLGFTGFLRISELLEIRIRNIAFHDDCVKIVIPKSKTDQVREGHIVHIVRSNGSYCPVSWLERYISDANLRQPNYFLICRLSKTKEGHLAKGIHPLRDGTVRENFQKYIAPLCGDNSSKNYGLHSLRSGGASTAINNGVSERLVGKHGRWIYEGPLPKR